MKPDIQTWVEAAATKHVRDGVPIEDTHTFLVGRALIQLLLYWRCEVPQSWLPISGDIDFTCMGLRLQEYVPPKELEGLAGTMYSALEPKKWAPIASLPEEVWRLITQITGLTQREWERIPNMVHTLLATEIRCPKCGLISNYAALGELREVSDPFAYGSSRSFHFNCSRCNSFLVVDAYPTPRKRIQINWADVRAVAFATLLTALGIKLCMHISSFFSK